MKWLGRYIMVKGVYANAILSGKKRATIRKGFVVPKYEEVIIHSGGRPIAKARITKIVHKKVKDLTDKDAKVDGFRTKKELLKSLKKIYGRLDKKDDITIIEFKVIQRLDQLDEEQKYMGLEPLDVARLGLRYLRDELTNKQRKVLETLLQTKSLRATAVALYGTIEKRYIIRRMLKSVLKKLVEKGLLEAR